MGGAGGARSGLAVARCACVRVRVCALWRCVGDGRAGLGASGRLAAGVMCARRQQLVHHLEAAAWPGPRVEGDSEEVLEEVVEEVVAEANFSMRAVRTGEAIGHGVRRQHARFSSIVKRAAVAVKSMAQLDLPN